MKRNTLEEIQDKIKDKKSIHFGVQQPGYHRYYGYFNTMLMSDVMISFDIVQYVEREWQNRQRFYIDNKWKWLSVPVNNGREMIFKKTIVNPEKLSDHWEFIKYIYRNTPYFKKYGKYLGDIYNKNWEYLNDLNEELVLLAKDILKIKCFYIRASDYYLPLPPEIKKGELITDCITRLIKPTSERKLYYPKTVYDSSAHYWDKKFDDSKLTEREKLETNGIEMKMFTYSQPVYDQYQFNKGHVFVPYLSIYDLIFNYGEDGLEILEKYKGKYI